MNKFSRSDCLKIVFSLIFSVTVFAVQTQAQLISEILKKVETHRKNLATLHADIMLGKYAPSLAEWTMSKGRILLIAKSNNIKKYI